MSEARSLLERLIRQIEMTGPLTVADYMTMALFDPRDGYYAVRPGIGADFITAPEASQMFGELIGLWCAHEWAAMGAPSPLRLIELGPGSGALMSDALRAGKRAPGFIDAVELHLVEASAPLRTLQTRALSDAAPAFHAALEDIAPGPSIVIANEFLDCLPVRQFVRTHDGWRERLIGAQDGALAFGLSNVAPLAIDLPEAPAGAVAEIAPGLAAVMQSVAERLRPGRALFIDYGSEGHGDSLQAVRAHAHAGVLTDPGRADLTAHVDFAAAASHARAAGLDVHGPIGQAAFLDTLGIRERAAYLARANPDRAARVARELARLTAPDQMGVLFRVLCVSSPGLPPPAGF